MSTDSIAIFEVNLGKATRNKGSYQWLDPDQMDLEKVKSELKKIAGELEKKLLKQCTSEKIEFFVTRNMDVADLRVSLAIIMQTALNSLTVEEWQKLGDDVKECMNGHLFEIKKLANSEATTLPKIVVQAHQSKLFNESASGAIIVSTEQDKAILNALLNLAQISSQTSSQISCQIGDIKSNLSGLAKIVSVEKAGEPITKTVFVSYSDYIKSDYFGIVFASSNKRIREVKCTDYSQAEKLYLANRLECEAIVKFATENVQDKNGKTKIRITHVLEVIEVLKDRPCPIQTAFNFEELISN